MGKISRAPGRDHDYKLGKGLTDSFHRHFRAEIAHSDEARREAFQLRYRVYCEERQFENAAEHPNQLEQDVYDAHSLHALVRHQETGTAVGVVRLITTRTDISALPVEDVCAHQFDRTIMADFKPSRNRSGEVSRFAVSKTAIRALFLDKKSPRTIGDGAGEDCLIHSQACQTVSQGLIAALFRMSQEHLIDHWYALMEPALARYLSRLGLDFCRIGPIVNHHGRRQPMLAKLSDLLTRIAQDNPELHHLIANLTRDRATAIVLPRAGAVSQQLRESVLGVPALGEPAV